MSHTTDDFGRTARARAAGFPPPRLLALDLDGVVYRGSTLLPGVVEAVGLAAGRGLDIRYVTNNATLHREQVAERLREMGLETTYDQVLTSAAAAATWLRERVAPGARTLVVGEAGLQRELRDVGLSVRHAGAAGPPSVGARPVGRQAAQQGPELRAPTRSEEETSPFAAVVVGLDRSFSYAALAEAQAAVRAGALLIATNRDPTLPVEGALLPGAGSVLAAVETAAAVRAFVIGKPEAGLAAALALGTGVAANETLFVGDRLDTDVAFGLAAGMQTLLVFTGVTTPDDLGPEGPRPHHVLDDLTGLGPLLDSLGL
jgi:4-nitrophenyl phosphatase